MTLRKLEAIHQPLGEILPLESWPPVFLEVDPAEIWVEEAYQRTPTDRSLKLVSRAVLAFSGRKYTPPKVVRLEDGRLVATDGQHTVIMALTRGVSPIVVQLVEVTELAGRAAAFVGQNSSRTNMTALQIHLAKVAARDEEAMTVDQVCARAGVKLCTYRKAVWEVGDSQAIVAIATLCGRRHAAGARRVLELLVQAGVAGIEGDHIKAVEALIFSDEFKGTVSDLTIKRVLMDEMAVVVREAGVFRATHRVPTWKALTSTLYQRCRRARATL